MVGNGDNLKSQGFCSDVELNLQGYRLTMDFYLLALPDYDVVLGAQWLCTEGPILWDFAKLTMSFRLGNQAVNLQGISSVVSKCVSPKKMVKEALKSYQGFLCQCSISEFQVPWQCKEQDEQWLQLNGEQMTQLEILLNKHVKCSRK